MIRFSTILAVCFSLSMACGACRKEANELVHNHNHEHHDHDHEGHEEQHDHEHDHDHDHHDHENQDNHNHSEKEEHAAGVITLKPEVAERFGVATVKVERQALSAGVHVGGMVTLSDQSTSVVSAPVSGVVSLTGKINVGTEVNQGAVIAVVKPGLVAGGDPMKIAKVELDAAKAEFDRVATLYTDRLVTVSEYNAAKAAYDRAMAAYSAPAASGVAKAPTSGVIIDLSVRTGETVEAGEPIATIASGGAMTLTTRMPVADYRKMGMPHDARVVDPYTGESVLLSAVGGHLSANKGAVAAAAGGYIPVTFTVPASAGLVPGSAVEVYLVSDKGSESLVVPRKAIVEQQGVYSVYVQLDEDCYMQVPVTLGGTDGASVEILSGLHGGENVVIDGVTAVRLAAATGSVPAGHSHSH